MAESAKDEKPTGEEKIVGRVRVGRIGDRRARGVAKAVAIDSHTMAVLTSPNLKKVDLSAKWAKEMQRIVVTEMRSRGLSVSTDVVGRMRGLVKIAYLEGKDIAMKLAKSKLGPYYEIFEEHIDDWLLEYSNIKEST